MTAPARITVICALPSEAQALLEHWRLPTVRERPFRVYGNDAARIVISGVGSHACAAAVGYAAALHDSRDDDLWLNLGIAGHGQHALGTPLLAARVSHHGRDGAWYPSLLFTPPCAVAELITYDLAVSDYPPQACCDMEAAGFMAATSRVASGDLVQVMKVVSDNAESGIAGIERSRVYGLMQNALPSVLELIERLRAVAARLPVAVHDAEAEVLLERWHFTHSQAHQLRQLLQRRVLLGRSDALDAATLVHCRNAAAVLASLRAEVDKLPLPMLAAP
jgi:adenosylhomocysteine nucleosidase